MKIFLVPLIFFGFTSFLFSQSKKETPKLVVGIVVDQMRYDFIPRYWDKFGEDGFKKLVNEGFSCKNARFNYVPTYTGPGHASIYTGTTPSVHGIIGNSWYDREKGEMIYCVSDGSVETIGGEGDHGKKSPEKMLSSTIGDELRLGTSFQSKVIGVSMKDRGAILPAGHAANGAYWFDGGSGKFISSTHYNKEIPQWVRKFNSRNLADKYLEGTWNTLLPIENYTESVPDNNLFEAAIDDDKGGTRTVFPYELRAYKKKKGYYTLNYTPWGNTIVKDFAMEAIKNEGMGKDDYPDLLAISFSSTDVAGHKFGPHSIELQDMYLRLDKEIAEILDFLDEEIGKDNYLVFLTADHGAVSVPAYLKEKKIPAGNFDSGKLLEGIYGFLGKHYGPGNWLLHYSNQQFFLNKKLAEEKLKDIEEMRRKLAEYVMDYKGIANAVTADELISGYFGEHLLSLVQNGYNQKRSGDVAVMLNPAWIEYSKRGTTHGSGFSYDTHVPLIWYGNGINKGNSTNQIAITDIAPTLSILLNTQFPNGCTGNPIPEVLK